MGKPDGRFGSVNVLSAGSACTEDVDTKIVGLDLDIDLFVDHRIYEHGCEGGVAACGRVERRNAHESMDTNFGLQHAVNVFAVDLEGHRFDTSTFAFELVRNFGFVFHPFRPAEVHAHEHLGPVLAFGSAGTGVDRHYGAAMVVFSREQHRGLELLQLPAEAAHLGLDIV